MKNFKVQMILRIVALTVTIYFSTLFFYQNSYTIAAIIFCLCVVQIVLLNKLIDSSNREMKKFLEGISYSDFSQNINISVLGDSFKELSDEMERVLKNIRQARVEKEESLKYLETVVEHIGIGLMCFNSKGEVALFNKTAKRILKVPHLKNLSGLNDNFNQFGEYLMHASSDTKQTYKLSSNGETLQLLISATEFRMKNQQMKLVSFGNIHQELEENEIEAWQKLIRVLTHEIMNSIAPISSLASTVNNMIMSNSSEAALSEESVNDVRAAVNTIHKRSEGLINFVNKFRDISKIPKPNFQPVKVSELFYRIRLLTEPALSKNNINFSTIINPENLEIIADPEMFEQVILNLINNSIQALGNKDNGTIRLEAGIDDRGRALIKAVDNGSGIAEELLDRIFVPFFSTKKEGSGIGLSISRRIIQAHGGSIWVQSKPNEETMFTIRL